jgi:hypothetical protein
MEKASFAGEAIRNYAGGQEQPHRFAELSRRAEFKAQSAAH